MKPKYFRNISIALRNSSLLLLAVCSAGSLAADKEPQAVGDAANLSKSDQAVTRIVTHSDYIGYSKLEDLVANSDLIAIGRVSGREVLGKYTSASSVTVWQQFEIEETVLGDESTSVIPLVTSGANVDNAYVSSILEKGGEIVLSIDGFGGLPESGRYLLFLERVSSHVDYGGAAPAYTILGSAAQGAFSISDDTSTRRYDLSDALSLVGQSVDTVAENLVVEMEEVPSLSDYATGQALASLEEAIQNFSDSFSPSPDDDLNHSVGITYQASPGMVSVVLADGVPSTQVWVGICGPESEGVNGCFPESFRRVMFDANGKAVASLTVNNDEVSYGTACGGPCSVVVASNLARYTEAPLEAQ